VSVLPQRPSERVHCSLELHPGASTEPSPVSPVIDHVIFLLVASRPRFRKRNLDDVADLGILPVFVVALFLG
jgi:hypothetical protein